MEKFEFYTLKEFNPINLSEKQLWDHVKAVRLQPFIRVQPGMKYHSPDLFSGDPNFESLFPEPILKRYELLRNLQQNVFYDEQFLAKSDSNHWEDYLKSSWVNIHGQKPNIYGQKVLIKKSYEETEKDLQDIIENNLQWAKDAAESDKPELADDFRKKAAKAKKALADHLEQKTSFKAKQYLQKKSYLANLKSIKAKKRQGLDVEKREVANLEKEFKDLPKLYQQFITGSNSDVERKAFVEKLENAYFRRDQIEAMRNDDYRGKTPKEDILKYAQQRMTHGNPLIAQDFKDKSLDGGVREIHTKHQMTGLDTLRKYCQTEKLLGKSNPGPKQKRA